MGEEVLCPEDHMSSFNTHPKEREGKVGVGTVPATEFNNCRLDLA